MSEMKVEAEINVKAKESFPGFFSHFSRVIRIGNEFFIKYYQFDADDVLSATKSKPEDERKPKIDATHGQTIIMDIESAKDLQKKLLSVIEDHEKQQK